jgi:hypothetical protein
MAQFLVGISPRLEPISQVLSCQVLLSAATIRAMYPGDTAEYELGISCTLLYEFLRHRFNDLIITSSIFLIKLVLLPSCGTSMSCTFFDLEPVYHAFHSKTLWRRRLCFICCHPSLTPCRSISPCCMSACNFFQGELNQLTRRTT